LVLKFSTLGHIDQLKSAEWLQAKNHLHIPFALKMPVHSLEVLELVNGHHEGLASLQSLGLGTQFYAYSLLRNQ
jgi:hypothetical protein